MLGVATPPQNLLPTTTSATTPAGTTSITTGAAGGGTATLADGTVINLSANPTVAGAQAGLVQQNILAQGNAAAQTALATGYGNEATSYQQAGAISGENAKVAGFAGDVLKYQEGLDVARSAGSAQAAAGAGGAAGGGSVLDLLRSTYQQGALSNQLIDVQTALDVGGYLEQQSATGAEVAAAQAQQNAATALSSAYSQQAAQASSQLMSISPTGPTMQNPLLAVSVSNAGVAPPLFKGSETT